MIQGTVEKLESLYKRCISDFNSTAAEQKTEALEGSAESDIAENVSILGNQYISQIRERSILLDTRLRFLRDLVSKIDKDSIPYQQLEHLLKVSSSETFVKDFLDGTLDLQSVLNEAKNETEPAEPLGSLSVNNITKQSVTPQTVSIVQNEEIIQKPTEVDEKSQIIAESKNEQEEKETNTDFKDLKTKGLSLEHKNTTDEPSLTHQAEIQSSSDDKMDTEEPGNNVVEPISSNNLNVDLKSSEKASVSGISEDLNLPQDILISHDEVISNEPPALEKQDESMVVEDGVLENSPEQAQNEDKLVAEEPLPSISNENEPSKSDLLSEEFSKNDLALEESSRTNEVTDNLSEIEIKVEKLDTNSPLDESLIENTDNSISDLVENEISNKVSKSVVFEGAEENEPIEFESNIKPQVKIEPVEDIKIELNFDSEADSSVGEKSQSINQDNEKPSLQNDKLNLTPDKKDSFKASHLRRPSFELQQKRWKKNINNVWMDIYAHRLGSVFATAIKDFDAPRYSEAIKVPLDLKQIKNKIRDNEITSTSEFYRDILLMFQNSLMYNREDSEIYKMALEIIPDATKIIEQLSATEFTFSYSNPNSELGTVSSSSTPHFSHGLNSNLNYSGADIKTPTLRNKSSSALLGETPTPSQQSSRKSSKAENIEDIVGLGLNLDTGLNSESIASELDNSESTHNPGSGNDQSQEFQLDPNSKTKQNSNLPNPEPKSSQSPPSPKRKRTHRYKSSRG
ncbi:hypothetical protein BB560_003511 [Smittium megazygosporum]|uniref:Bromo domain-containing protein n=1 Tax=Smittium megazygosporum TaxID=133381 RepID=A0A2T9ZBT3_9FUNG|nr:hypothetical protein BB560_003511 [Smittium megazygosporum]